MKKEDEESAKRTIDWKMKCKAHETRIEQLRAKLKHKLRSIQVLFNPNSETNECGPVETFCVETVIFLDFSSIKIFISPVFHFSLDLGKKKQL